MNLSEYKGYSKQKFILGDNFFYPKRFSKALFLDWLLQTEQYLIRTYLINLRSEEYYTYINPNRFLKYYYQRKKNKLGLKLGFFIPAGCFDLGLHIAHYGSIIINPLSHIGKNCTIHGNCCIGNSGDDTNGLPQIGDNVDIGQNAQILGDVYIAKGTKIGAGSIVIHSVLEENSTVVGIPGRVVHKK
ncbi:serine O-acetyltransferase [Sphingobacterium daejeonense]|uniref:serine O-acetyltransferase n=1 Tax=Sphingobacterium daejeonense TaxID=371142 RepID=UPI0010C483F9|nr:serine acetyltransferase [Sphingobacterium daejeonense]VTQ00013.1 Serine acetyltransferase [Sphingobacterium daejeonense]